jgi:hypothetical protein
LTVSGCLRNSLRPYRLTTVAMRQRKPVSLMPSLAATAPLVRQQLREERGVVIDECSWRSVGCTRTRVSVRIGLNLFGAFLQKPPEYTTVGFRSQEDCGPVWWQSRKWKWGHETVIASVP